MTSAVKQFIIGTIFVIAEIAVAQGLAVGTYKGTRICSDGATPTDVLAGNPVYLSVRADGSYSSSSDLFSNGGTCTELTAGMLHLSGGTLFTTTQVLEQCGQCDSPPNQRKAEQMPARSTPKGFVIENTFTDYREGGSCKRGQHMIVTFVRVNDSYEDLSRSCKSVEAF